MTPPSASARYGLVLSPGALRALTGRLPEKVAAAVHAFVTGALLENPQCVGKPLRAPLAPAYSARRGEYRVTYFIDDDARVVNVTAIAHRSDA